MLDKSFSEESLPSNEIEDIMKVQWGKEEVSFEEMDLNDSCLTEDFKISLPCNSKIIEDLFSDSDDDMEEVNNRQDKTPLKKRKRMFEIPYSLGHAININLNPVLGFTSQEQSQVKEYMAAIRDYQNQRWDYMCTQFPKYKEMMVGIIAMAAHERKIPFNKPVEKTLFKIGLEFTKNNSKIIYEDMNQLSTDVRKTILNTTYPALYVVMYSILEGNKNKPNWIAQQQNTIHCTPENHKDLGGALTMFQFVRPSRLCDQVNRTGQKPK